MSISGFSPLLPPDPDSTQPLEAAPPGADRIEPDGAPASGRPAAGALAAFGTASLPEQVRLLASLTTLEEAQRVAAAGLDFDKIDRDVEALYQAMAGLGTDEQAVFEILENRSPEERAAIEARFAALHGDAWVTLRVAIDDEFSGEEHGRAIEALNAGRDFTSRGEVMVDRGRTGATSRDLRQFITWYAFGVGGKTDAEDGLPRLTGKQVREEMLPKLEPGDVILNGNNGGLSHAALYIGDGKIVHAMATEKTMRGHSGRLWDTLRAPVDILREQLGMKPRKQGVFIERVDDFFERFERDTYVVMRAPGLDAEAASRGLEQVKQLVGKPYDWDFAPGNDAYYCTEVASAFYRAALGERAPRLGGRKVDHGELLYRDAVLDPLDVFASPDLEPVAFNDAARKNFADRLGGE